MKPRAAVILAAVSAAMAVVGSVACAQPVPTTDVPVLRATLYDDAAKPEQREQAAQRLLARPDPAAREVLRTALSEVGRPAVQLAAARALAGTPTADPTLVTQLFALVDPGSGDAVLDAAARALSAYKADGRVLSQLIALTNAGSENVRVAAIRGVGTFVDKSAAAALLPLVEPGQPPKVTAAAAAALAYLTGLDPSTDAAGWRAWWAGNQNKPDAAFQADLVKSRAARYDVARSRVADLEDEFARLLGEQYQRASRDARSDLLLRYLRSPEPSVRAIGCRIARTAAENDVTPTAVKEQLRQLVGDASPDVRRRAAAALSLINDADAVVPILTQLNQETDSTVRAAFADALRPTLDLRAAPALLAMLDDPSIETAQAAAGSLAGLGPQLHATHPAADAAAERIIAVLDARTKPVNNVELRIALLQAVASLQSPAVAPQLQQMLEKRREDDAVSRSLLTALGHYKNSRYTDTIVPWLHYKTDKDTRLAAVKALGECADNFSAVQQPLGELLGPNESQDVRDAAWRVLVSLFRTAPPSQLTAWEGKLAGDPGRLVVVFTEQRNRALLDNDANKAADRNQQIGDAYSKIGRWDAAVEAYKAAIATRQAQKQPIDLLSEVMMPALLRSRQFGPAIDFIQQRLRESPSYQVPLGQILRKEVARLVEESRDYEGAIDLIDRALKIDNPPLSERTRTDLRDRQAEVQNRDRPRNSTPNLSERPILTAMAR